MEQYAIDLFDGHCDAVFLRYLYGGGLRRNDGHVDLEQMCIRDRPHSAHYRALAAGAACSQTMPRDTDGMKILLAIR